MSKHYRTLKHHHNGRGSATRGWKSQKPGYHQRTVMLKKCGKKCFLGANKSYPICKKNTCKISRVGLQSAYNRARQYHKQTISAKASKLLKKYFN